MVALRRVAAALGVLLLAGCGGDGPSGPGTPEAPTITVTGVAEGTTYPGPVTITVAVDRGNYEATLDGANFSSGGTVSAPGPHLLRVSARNGTATSTKEVRFTIAGAAGGALRIQLINLGANASGGGGDAILLTDSSAAGKVHGLIDAGPGINGNEEYVRNVLQLYGVTSLEFVQLTHAHYDHYAGLTAVMQAIRPKRFIYNGQVSSSPTYTSFINNVARVRADSVIVPTGNTPYVLRFGAAPDAATLSVLPPLATWIPNPTVADSSAWANEGSLGTSVRLGTFRMFLTGDGEFRANLRWMRQEFESHTKDVDVLKAGHHGANDAVFNEGRASTGTSSWLTHTSPETVVISANGTTHPLAQALGFYLQTTGNRTYCTHVHGNITLSVTRTGGYEVSTEKSKSTVCTPAA